MRRSSLRGYVVGYAIASIAFIAVLGPTTRWGNVHPVVAAHVGAVLVIAGILPLMKIAWR